MPPFQETLNAGVCGPASLKIVLAYYGVEKTEDELAERTHCSAERGTTAEELARVARELGFDVTTQNGATFADLANWLLKGVPPIVDWFTRGRDDYPADRVASDGHYSVITGLTDTHIMLQDPEIGAERTMAREVFEKVWFDFSGDVIRPDELLIRQLIAIRPKEWGLGLGAGGGGAKTGKP